MTSPHEVVGSSLWDLLGFIYIWSLGLSPLIARWRWGLRAALYCAGLEFLLVPAISALVYLTLYPDWQPLPRLGTEFHTREDAMLLIAGVTQFQTFAKLTLINPVITVMAGFTISLIISLGLWSESLRRRWTARWW